MLDFRSLGRDEIDDSRFRWSLLSVSLPPPREPPLNPSSCDGCGAGRRRWACEDGGGSLILCCDVASVGAPTPAWRQCSCWGAGWGDEGTCRWTRNRSLGGCEEFCALGWLEAQERKAFRVGRKIDAGNTRPGTAAYGLDAREGDSRVGTRLDRYVSSAP